MRVFIDTNILIDFVCDREGFAEDANKLFAWGCMGKIQLMTSALSYVTAMYVVHKYGYQRVRQSLTKIADFVEVLDLSGRTVIEMLSSDWTDYEDATQNALAMMAMADCIVTRNKKDFVKSLLPVYSASEFFEVYERSTE